MTNPDDASVASPALHAASSGRRSAALLLVMLVVALGVPALLGRPSVTEPFDQSFVDQFELDAPEVVFLGNSLLDTRIDPELFEELTGKPTVSMAIDGIAPGIWYLQLNDVIGASPNLPETVFVFFHDDLITRRISFTGQEDRKLVERLTHREVGEPADDLFDPLGFGSRIKQAFGRIYPLGDSPTSGRSGPVASIGARIAGMSELEVSEESDRVFAFANKREQAAIIQQPKFHGSFDSMIDGSWLPAMIERADMLGIDLTFVRVSARPNNDGSPNEPASLARYSSDLSNYLAGNDVAYIDMTGHAGLDAGMYYDGYHLKNRFRTYYTEFFAEWMLSNADESAGQ
ncbi:MAG: hypothetical protein V3T49_00150 [Dehalococcoidia bacterium]